MTVVITDYDLASYPGITLGVPEVTDLVIGSGERAGL